MKYLFAILVLLPFAAAAHSPAACPALDPVAQFVGVTQATIDGQAHLLGWLPLCRAEFPGSRVCTTRDLVESEQLPDMEVGEEWWVMPHWIDERHEYSGRFTSDAVCSLIGQLNDRPSPIFFGRGCNNVVPVACCALTP